MNHENSFHVVKKINPLHPSLWIISIDDCSGLSKEDDVDGVVDTLVGSIGNKTDACSLVSIISTAYVIVTIGIMVQLGTTLSLENTPMTINIQYYTASGEGTDRFP